MRNRQTETSRPSQRRAHRVAASLAALIALLTPIAGAVPATSPSAVPDCGNSEGAISRFYRSVEQGELVVFGRTLARRQLRPVRVEQAYELASQARSVSVHVELLSAIPFPKDETMVVRSVAAVIGADGHIAETHAYVTPK